MTVSSSDNAQVKEPVPVAPVQQEEPVAYNNQNDKKTEEEPKEDPNWRAFREARKKDRQEKEAAEKLAREKSAEADALKAAMEAAFSKQTNISHQRTDKPNAYAEYDTDESEDERIEKKVQAVIAAREQAMEAERSRREQQEYPQRLANTYSDFNQIVSSENLDYLEFHYPEVANPLKRLSDGYDKWADIYKAVKKFVPNSVHARHDSQKAENNFNKPKSMSSATLSNPGDPRAASIISEEKKAANWARMQSLLKGVG